MIWIIFASIALIEGVLIYSVLTLILKAIHQIFGKSVVEENKKLIENFKKLAEKIEKGKKDVDDENKSTQK